MNKFSERAIYLTGNLCRSITNSLDCRTKFEIWFAFLSIVCFGMEKKMNMRNYIIRSSLLVFGLCICAGCSAQQGEKYTLEELNNLVEIRIYSAENNELIKTISDEEELYQYNQCSIFDDSGIVEHQDELKRNLEGAKEQYYLVAYKYPAARFGGKELEENTTITLYEDTCIIKMTVAEESIKAFTIPEEFLTFYYELSEEEINSYRALVEEGVY